jgi:hypothetical protein
MVKSNFLSVYLTSSIKQLYSDNYKHKKEGMRQAGTTTKVPERKEDKGDELHPKTLALNEGKGGSQTK